jgi:cbb3-type cytochrome oxidase subunit 3
MQPIIIENSKIPTLLSIFINISAITLFPFIISRDKMSDVTIRHEMIHIEQQKELLVIFFYILYVWYWLKGKVKGMSNDDAYMNIPFEQEAYRKMYEEDYLDKRKRHSWYQYIN